MTIGLKPKESFQPSAYQLEIFDWVESRMGDKNNLIVEAVAGSGKTKTGIEMFKLLPETYDSAFVAFNKHIADELKSKLPEGANAKTYHSLGFSTLRKTFDNVTTKLDKVESYLKQNRQYMNQRWLFGATKKLVGLCKATGQSEFSIQDLESLAFSHDVDLYEEKDVDLKYTIFDMVMGALRYSLEYPQIVDFDDMIWLPNVLDTVSFYEHDFLFVDEVQDTNMAQLYLASHSVHDDGIICGVGDRKQCQPKGTKVAIGIQGDRWNPVPPIQWKSIESIQKGDYIMSFDRHGQYFVKKAKVIDVEHHTYRGYLYRISSENFSTLCTPEHKWMVRWNKKAEDKWCTYLMKQGNRYRVGKTVMFRSRPSTGGIFGLAQRTQQEKADCGWILKIHDSEKDALVYEQIISNKYQIPQTIFHYSGSTTHFTQDSIDKIYEEIGNKQSNAIECLKAHGRDFDFPIYTNQMLGKRQRQGRTTIFITQTCNLIDDLMQVISIPDEGIITRKYSGKWNPISISKELYVGQVYSLEIENYHNYVSDGLVTQNSIYRFRGADETAMDKLREALNADELPLSISYRCPTKIRDLVNQKFPEIKFEVPEWAKEGTIRNIMNYNLYKELKPDDMVLCRVNADLVTTCFALLRSGTKATIKGRDIGKGLISLINKSHATYVNDLIDWMSRWRDAEIQKAHRLGQESKIQFIQDKFETLFALTEGTDLVSDVSQRCDIMFSDEKSGVVLSTIHRAKGLEAERVYILRPDLIPHPAAKSAVDKNQERNLEYVAITRSKNELVYVQG